MTTSKSTLTNKIDGNLIKGWLSSNKDLLTKIGVYSVNYFPELFSKIHKLPTEIGNAYGAIGFAALDVLERKNSKFKRLTKFGGYLWYIGEGIYDLTLALTDQENVAAHLGNFALDVTMASQLGKDMGSLYKELEKESEQKKKFSVSKDLKEIVSFFKEKFKKENKSPEEIKDSKSKLKDYLSNFGKSALTGISYGIGAGYGFGKDAFEKLKENYSIYRTKQKEKKELKKIKDEEEKINDNLEKIRQANKRKMQKK